jgi:hypothetical protein
LIVRDLRKDMKFISGFFTTEQTEGTEKEKSRQELSLTQKKRFFRLEKLLLEIPAKNMQE